jgi:hypothetical protein
MSPVDGRGNAVALAGLLTLVLGCCVAGGLVAVLREEGAAPDAAAVGGLAGVSREEPATAEGPFRYAAVTRTREAGPPSLDGVFRARDALLVEPAAGDAPESGALFSAPPGTPTPDAPAPELAAPVEPAVHARLRALELLGPRTPAGPVPKDAIELLEQSGRASRFARGSQEYDRTASRLATLAAPVLDDVVFQLQPRASDVPDDQESVHALVAWSRGERFDTPIDPELEWESLTSVVGLLNVLTRSRASRVRFVLDDDEGTAEVVAGLEHSLRAAVAEGLVGAWLDPLPTDETAGAQFLKALQAPPPE